MTREQALVYSTYTETGNGLSGKMTLVFKPKAFQYLINTIYDSLEQRIAELEHGNGELRLSIDASRIYIAELELRLSLSDSALDEYKQQVKELESPRTCEGCKWHKGKQCMNLNSIAFNGDNAVYNDDYCNDYEPKKDTE